MTKQTRELHVDAYSNLVAYPDAITSSIAYLREIEELMNRVRKQKYISKNDSYLEHLANLAEGESVQLSSDLTFMEV